MKDFQLDPKDQKTIDQGRKQLLAKKAWDQMEAEVQEAFEIRQELPAIKAQIATLTKRLDQPQKLEATLKAPYTPKGTVKRPDLGQCAVAAVTAELRRFAKQIDPGETIAKMFTGDEHKLSRTVATNMMIRSATAPGMTTIAGFAAELVDHEVLAIWKKGAPLSVTAQLLEYCRSTSFGANGSLTIPHRAANDDGKARAAWVPEGGSIPHVQAQTGAMALWRSKLAAVSSYTEELANSAVTDIADWVSDAIFDDTTVALDQSLLSTDASVPGLRPRGLREGIAALPSGATPDADLAALFGAMATVRAKRPVLIMDHVTHTKMMMYSVPNTGVYPFREELMRGQIFNTPVITSANAPADVITILDADALYMATPIPLVDMSNSASIVMLDAVDPDPRMGVTDHHVEDGASVHVSDAATVTGGPAEVRSMFQTNAVGIRIILDGVSWGFASPSHLAWLQVTW